MKFGAVVVAAGRGERAGGAPKQFRPLLGRPALLWSLEALLTAGAAEIIVVVASEQVGPAERLIAALDRVSVRPGGATRTDSVRAGLAAIGDVDAVLIHDAARPGLTPAVVSALLAALGVGENAAAPALPVPDALMRVDAGGHALDALARDGVMRVQTPQAFRLNDIRAAYAAAPAGASFADDLAVMRATGARVRLITGDARLMKITYPEDFAVLERLMSANRIVCVGHGVDAHRFGEGDHVTLCGVRIPHDKGLVGHSDADAGWHALVDAILGALAEGDIGAHFPPSDAQWKGADSERFLRHAAQLAAKAGATLQHVDVTLLCERPKIGPHRDAMRERTAAVLGLPLARVSVKATTTERMGFLGREEGLAAQATATLERPA